MTNKDSELLSIADEISACDKCSLYCSRNKTVPGTGDPNASVVFIGEGPGAEEDQTGLPFVGKSGQLLTKMIEALGVHRADVFILNVVKCRPPGNRPPTEDEMKQCLPFLKRQLDTLNPKAICTLGKTAAVGLGLLSSDEYLSTLRGRIHLWNSIPVIVTYHPSYLLRRPDEKSSAWSDLKLLLPYLKKEV